jgi:kynureninase
MTTTDAAATAAALDVADPLAGYRDRFLPSPGVLAYFDGNSLGRPLAATADRLDRFVRAAWGGGLIRGWTGESPGGPGPDGPWMEWPERVGDRIAAVALGAGPGQTVVADSTTVLLYKLARAAVDADPGRREIVLATDDFPTDRYVLEGIADERGCVLRWIDSDPAAGVTPQDIAEVVGRETALVVLSHVAYRSGWLADAPAITAAAHDAGASTSRSAAPTSICAAAPAPPRSAMSEEDCRMPSVSPCRAGWAGASRSRWAPVTTRRRGCAPW